MATLADTNVLLDIATNDATWSDWSLNALDDAALEGPIVINPVVYAEFSVGYRRIEEVDRLLGATEIALVEIPRAALFLAGKVFRRYRRRGGQKAGVLPDFFIGAHAAVACLPLITRDRKRFQRYFPTVRLITPE
jgi:hypothetical protein